MSSQGIQWAASCSGTAADTSVPFGCSIGGTALSVRNRFGAHVSSAVIFVVRSTVCLRQGKMPACLGGVPGTSTGTGIGPVVPLALALREEVLKWRQKEEAATTLALGTAQRLPVPHTSADKVRQDSCRTERLACLWSPRTRTRPLRQVALQHILADSLFRCTGFLSAYLSDRDCVH